MKYKLRKTPDEVLEMAVEGRAGWRRSTWTTWSFPRGRHPQRLGLLVPGVRRRPSKRGRPPSTFPTRWATPRPTNMSGSSATCGRTRPGIEKAVISVHCHDDLGLAVANSLAAVRAGAPRRWSAPSTAWGSGRATPPWKRSSWPCGPGRDQFRARHRHRHGAHLPDEPARQRADGRRGAAQQGHRRGQRLCPRVGHPPRRGAERAHHV